MAHKIINDEERRLRRELANLDRAVDAFAAAMKAKLHRKAAEGWRGWDDPNCLDAIKGKLVLRAVQVACGREGQEADIANFAMMVWRQGNRKGDKRGM